MNKLACLLAAAFTGITALAQPPARPPVVALVAAVGDQVDVVRQRQSVGSHIEPFSRRSFAVNGQSLNYAVLRGLDRAIEEEEPEARRVLVAWTAPAPLRQQLADASGRQRETLVLAALKAHLQDMPARAGWDRIEAVIPGYFFEGLGGLGRKLSGVGFYVQPLSNEGVTLQFDPGTGAVAGVMPSAEPAKDSDYKTVDPNTGEVGHSATYIAAYMYFQRVTLDARTLDVLAVKPQFDNIKYADPKATAIDVADQIPLSTMTAKLLDLAEQSAYTSVRGKSYVTTTPPRAVDPAASAGR